jgi:hypothetical protein
MSSSQVFLGVGELPRDGAPDALSELDLLNFAPKIVELIDMNNRNGTLKV